MHTQGCTPMAAVAALGTAAKIGTFMHRPFQAYRSSSSSQALLQCAALGAGILTATAQHCRCSTSPSLHPRHVHTFNGAEIDLGSPAASQHAAQQPARAPPGRVNVLHLHQCKWGRGSTGWKTIPHYMYKRVRTS